MAVRKYGRYKVIAAAQGVGGIVGLVVFYTSGEEVTTVHLLLLGLISFAFWAGTELWRGKSRGLDLSIYCQFLQIPIVLGSLFSYKFIMGPSLVVGYFPGQLPVFLGVMSQAFIYINVEGIDPGFGINLVALVFVIILMRTSASEYGDYCKLTRARTARKVSEADQ